MARTIPTNFDYYSGPNLEQDSVLAADSQLWLAGAPGYFNSSGLADPIATDGVNIDFLFAENQTTSTSTSTVKILKIPGASTKLVGFVSADADDTTAAQSNVGHDYGIHVSDNTSGDTVAEVASVNKSETSAVAVKLDALMSTVEPQEHATTDSPARVVFHVKQAILDA